MNNFIHAAFKALKAASMSGGTITEEEILYFQFKIYKEIKAPIEWTSHILFLESTVVSQLNYLPNILFNEVQSIYTNLTNQGLWHPSDKTLEEQALAMVAQQQQQGKGKMAPPKKEASTKPETKNKPKNLPSLPTKKEH